MTLSEWLNQYGGINSVDYSALKPLVDVGFGGASNADWSFNATPGDSGDKPGYTLTPDAYQRLSAYQVADKSSDGARTYSDVTGPGFTGQVSTPIDKDTWLDKFGMIAPFLLGGYGLMEGAGLFGGGSAAEAGGSALANMPQATNLAAELAGTAAIPGLSEAAIGVLPSLGAGSGLSALASMGPATSFAAELAGTAAIPGLSESAIASLPAMNLPFNAATSALANMPQATDLKPELTGTAPVDGLTTPNLSDKLPSLIPSGGGSTSTLPGWLKDNGKWLAPLLGAGVGLLGGEQKSGGGYVDSGYRPTITRGGWSPSAAKPSSVTPNIGLLNLPTTGVQNAGLWRFLGGK